MVKILGLLCLLIVAACSSGAIDSQELNDPLNAIYSAVESSMTMGIQGYSENRRDIYSRPFLVTQTDELKRAGFRERGLAHVTILGNERPYTIEVQISIERGRVTKKESDIVYSFDRYDQRLARLLLKNILAGLHRELRDRNVIDDFKPF